MQRTCSGRTVASVDVREFTAVEGLRRRMIAIIDEFLEDHPRSASRPAHEPFYFCAADLVVLPTPFAADTLKGFLDGLNQVSVHSIPFHRSPPRRHRMSNDFSNWLEQQVGLTAGAVGGIPNQIIHKLTGVLVHSLEGCAFRSDIC